MNSANITTLQTNNDIKTKAEKSLMAQEIEVISKACKFACLSNELTIDEAAFAFSGLTRISTVLNELIIE